MSIGQVVGAVAGFFIGGPKGAYYGYMLGTLADPPPGPNTKGPRLSDLTVQSSADGAPLPDVWGTARIAGNVIWSTGLTERKKTESAGGGSGGGGATSTTYSYSTDVAIAICEGPIAGVRRIWADTKLLYDVSTGSDLVTLSASATRSKSIRVYTGSETQQPDPLIQAVEGVGDTPAYLGTAYVVLEDLQLADFGNRLPNFTFEIVKTGTEGTATTLINVEFTGENVVSVKYKPGKLTKVVTLTTGAFVGYDAPHYTYGCTVSYYYILPNGTKKLRFRTNLYRLNYDWGLQCNTQNFDYDDDSIVLANPSSWSQALLLTLDQPHSLGLSATPLGGTLSAFKIGDILTGHTTNYVSADYVAYPRGDAASYTGFTIHKREDLPAVSVVAVSEADGYTLGDGYSIGVISGEAPSYAVIKDFIGQEESGSIFISDNYIYVGTRESGQAGIYRIPKGQVLDAGGVFAIADLEYDKVLHGSDNSLSIGPGHETDSILHGYGTGFYKSVEWGTWDYLGVAPITFNFQRFKLQQVSANLVVTGDATHAALSSVGTLDQSTETLQAVVTAMLSREQLTTGLPLLESTQYDVAALSADIVRGYVRDRPMAVREALEPLMLAYHFDMPEIDGKIKAVKRGGASVATLVNDDLGASEQTDSNELDYTRNNEVELPSEVSITYPDIGTDFQPGTQYSRQLTARHENKRSLTTTLAMTSGEAAKMADVLRKEAWWCGRYSYQLSCTYKHARLTPSDVISVPVNGRAESLRLVQVDVGAPGMVKIQAVPDLASIYSSTAVGSDGVWTPQTVTATGPSLHGMLDCCMLRDGDTDAAWYVAMGGWSEAWAGAELFKSSDDGATWTSALIASANNAVSVGTVTSVLGDADCRVWDKHSVLTVRMYVGSLSSATEVSVLDGANAALVGASGRWELLQFKNATLNGDGSYTLTDLLRGRRGTEWAASQHAANDTIIIPSATTIQQLEVPTSEMDAERLFKVVSVGDTLEDATAQADTYTGERLMPLSVADLSAVQQPNKNIVIKWQRRDRIAKGFHASTLPLTEASESYSIDISYSGIVVRTLTSTTNTVTYTADQVALDTGGLALTATVTVYQVSAVVGRGHGASVDAVIPGLTVTPQISTITLGGTFVVGESWTATINPTTTYTPITGTRVAVGGDTNLDGVAAALDTAITANLGAKAATTTVVTAGSVITVTGQYAFSLSAYFGYAMMDSYLVQSPSPVVSGVTETYFIGVGAGTWGAGLVTGVIFTVSIRSTALGAAWQTVTATGTSADYLDGVFTPLLSALQSSTAFAGMGLTFAPVYYTSGPNAGHVSSIKVTSTVPGASKFELNAYSNDPSHGLIFGTLSLGVDPVPIATPQISEVSILATAPAAGCLFKVKINSTTYTYTSIGGDTQANIGAGLVALINADGAMAVTAAMSYSGSDRYKFKLTADVANTAFTVSTSSSLGGTLAVATTQNYALS